MLATLGFAVQAWVTGKGPIDNAIDHLRDPFGQNSKACATASIIVRSIVRLHFSTPTISVLP